MIVGFIDTTCSPSSVYGAYNALKSEDKKIINEIDMGHAIRGSFSESIKWMKEIITKQ
ncbi:MAG: acetylxylan esterase [Victivallales bacterium]|nr:acetylxylan esterase [Victivallales bacterium]